MSQQGNWQYCKKCEGLFFVGNNPGVCPAGGAHDDSLSGGYLLSQSALQTSPWTPGQPSWRICEQCQGLFYSGNDRGVCPVHIPASATYFVPTAQDANANLQGGWSWCNKCQGLFFGRSGTGSCAAGSGHDSSGSGQYYLSQSGHAPSGWRYCGKCEALFFELAPSISSSGKVANTLGVCPAGGAHRNSGGDYVLSQSGPGEPGWCFCSQCLSLFFRGNNLGVCPAPQPHTAQSGEAYFLTQNYGQNFPWGVQTKWKWCSQCQGLYFAKSGPGLCPARAANNQPSSHTTPEGDEDYALIQMGGNFNYILSNPNGNPLINAQVNITITEDLVYASGTGHPGVSFQLNAYSNNNQTTVGWQQYSIAFDGVHFVGTVNNWNQAGVSIINTVQNGGVELGKLQGWKIPKGSSLQFFLFNDPNTGSVTGAGFAVILPGNAKPIAQAVTLEKLTQQDGSPVTAKTLAQVVAFQLNIVGINSSANAVFSSGQGTISYSSNGADLEASAFRAFPSSAANQNTFTNEQANTVYSEMPAAPSAQLPQKFSVTLGVPQ